MLDDKINSAIRILKMAETQAKIFNEPVEIAYSGGKDSDVLLELAKMAEINFRAIYKNTTIDPPGTIQHVRANGVEIRQPRKTFFELIKAKGIPSRFRRFCCEELKEYKILNVCCTGVRAEESSKRKKRYKTFNACLGTGKNHRYMFFPVFDWSLSDVVSFIESRDIKIAQHYYKNGSVDYSLRLGCLGCPLKADNGKSDFKNNPAILRAWIRAAKVYVLNHPCRKIDYNAYDLFFANVFCNSMGEYLLKKSPDLFGNVLNVKKEMELYFNTTL